VAARKRPPTGDASEAKVLAALADGPRTAVQIIDHAERGGDRLTVSNCFRALTSLRASRAVATAGTTLEDGFEVPLYALGTRDGDA
jgi:hypothetical protein